MDFSKALIALKQGLPIQRAGWNGKGMFVYHIPSQSYRAQTDVAREHFGELVEYNAYLAIRCTDGTVSTWVPSVNDVLAEDWSVI
jgi:hypothetical protein